MAQTKPDIQITNSGSGFFGIYGESKRGQRWLENHVQGVSTMMYDRGVAFTDDRRYALDIANAAIKAGLRVE